MECFHLLLHWLSTFFLLFTVLFMWKRCCQMHSEKDTVLKRERTCACLRPWRKFMSRATIYSVPWKEKKEINSNFAFYFSRAVVCQTWEGTWAHRLKPVARYRSFDDQCCFVFVLVKLNDTLNIPDLSGNGFFFFSPTVLWHLYKSECSSIFVGPFESMVFFFFPQKLSFASGRV